MRSQTIVGIGLGLYFGSFTIAALLGLPGLSTYLAASAVGAATVGYAIYTESWQVMRTPMIRCQCLIGVFLAITASSYFLNRSSYDVSLTLKVAGYVSVFCVSSITAMMTGQRSLRACMNSYMACLLIAMAVTLVVDNRNSHNHRLLGPTYQEGISGTGLHHNEVGSLGMTAVMLATVIGWRAVLLVTPPAIYAAHLAGSRGSVLGIVIALFVFAIAKEILSRSSLRRFGTVSWRSVYFVASAVCIGVVAMAFAGDFIANDVLKLNSENRGISSGFTGRVDVWQGMVDQWKQNPVVGQGYGVVRGEALHLGETADGGFLLLTAELGAAGLFLFLFLIYRATTTSLWGILNQGDDSSVAMLVFVVAFCFTNIFESRFVGTGSVGLGMFIYVCSLSVFYPHPEVLNGVRTFPNLVESHNSVPSTFS